MRSATRRRVLACLLPAALALAGGCRTTPWIRGSIEEGRPRIERPFPKDVAFFVDKTEKRVGNAFRKALRARGFEVAEKEDESDVVLKATVESWEVNDMGFGGVRGDRDDMDLSVALVDRRRKHVLARARITLRSDFRILAKYVETF